MSVTENYKTMKKAAEVDDILRNFRQVYTDKYFDLFCSKYKIEGLSYQALYRFYQLEWTQGKAWIRKNPIGEAVVCDFAESFYNYYNFPTKVQLVTRNNAPESEVPVKALQTVDVDGAIVYLRPGKKGLKQNVDYYIGKLAEAETCITINLAIQRTPWIFSGDNATQAKIKQLTTKILGNDIVIGTDMDKDEVASVELPRDYIIDRLTEYEERIENKLKTLLGLDNQGGYLNREQQNLDTTNSNNMEINASDDSFYNCLKEGFERVNKATGLNLKISKVYEPVEQIGEVHEKKEDPLND